MAKRVMSIWLPQLPLDRLRRLRDPRVEVEFAVISEIKNAFRLTHVSAAASEAGLVPGMSVADARAICPKLLTEPRNPAREEMLLRALRRWADRLSPWIAIDKPNGLMLDITGCSHLFGGEADMAAETIASLDIKLITSKIGIADTKGAAQALARFSADRVRISTQGELKRDLKDLPIEALSIDPKISNNLRRVGLHRIGQLYDIKPSELSRRYGLALMKSLAMATGQMPDPISPLASDPVFAAQMNLPDPIGYKSDLEDVLDKLSHSVCTRLKAAHFGARSFSLTVRCVDTGDHVLTIGFARPCHDAVLVKRQFDPKIDTLKIQYGADWFRLKAEMLEPIKTRQRMFEGDEQDTLEDLGQLITTLGNRLGFDRVRRFTPKDSHHPDCEFEAIEAADSRPVPSWPEATRERPHQMFRPERLRTLTPGRPPKAFEWRKARHETLSAYGPERLSPEWWKLTRDEVKDYWAVETKAGPRLWLLTYPQRTPPDWFVTGQFL